ncbi:SDR family NAD(P)-dependent oxidoreductase [Nocardia sp. NRRL S-836]|uniref:SDR family NAD(P)-dependent oxidoreductase n=1 Tax=Nocardia sp. NRRL S-836 TaxID=1519492 RepID=UPI0009E88D2E
MLNGVQAAATSELGGVDSVFAAAGIIHRGSLLDSDVADVERVMAVNWRGLMYTVKAHLPFLVDSADGLRSCATACSRTARTGKPPSAASKSVSWYRTRRCCRDRPKRS